MFIYLYIAYADTRYLLYFQIIFTTLKNIITLLVMYFKSLILSWAQLLFNKIILYFYIITLFYM